MFRYCWAALPHGAMGLSAVCDCGISWSYSLTIFAVLFWFQWPNNRLKNGFGSPQWSDIPTLPASLKIERHFSTSLRMVILYFFKWKILSDDRRLYPYDSKWNSRSDVDGLTHTKQLLNLLCIVYILIWVPTVCISSAWNAQTMETLINLFFCDMCLAKCIKDEYQYYLIISIKICSNRNSDFTINGRNIMQNTVERFQNAFCCKLKEILIVKTRIRFKKTDVPHPLWCQKDPNVTKWISNWNNGDIFNKKRLHIQKR